MKRKRVNNRQFAKARWFMDVCGFAGIVPTKRQASKYRNEKGKAYSFDYPNGAPSAEDKKKEMEVLKAGLALLGKWGSFLEEHKRI